jgi:hypothetical protein
VHTPPGSRGRAARAAGLRSGGSLGQDTRHIDIRRFFVRDMVAAGILKLVPLRTHLMVADALTKSLPSPAHIKHRDIMLGHVPFAARTLRNSVRGG